jgi:cell division septation protein DedD
MGLIRKKTLFFAAVLLVFSGLAYAQNVGQLGTEIQSLEQRLSTGISSVERHDVLVRLAQLRQLSGNIATAAANWLEAAAINPNNDVALITGAYCLMAIGEWEKATLALRPFLVSGKRGPMMLQAWYLDACLRAWSPSSNGNATANSTTSGGAIYGDASALAALAANPDFTHLRPLIYYTLWRTINGNPDIRGAGNAEQWKSRLLAEFPKSPEARVVNSENAEAPFAISAVQSPLWLFLPGIAGSVFTEPLIPVETIRRPITPPVVQPVTPPVVQPATPPVVSPAVTTGVLQTGLFSREANANAHSEALRKAGFSATISRKQVNGVDHFAVTVPAGPDSKKTTQDLKNAGFDSFPIR